MVRDEEEVLQLVRIYLLGGEYIVVFVLLSSSVYCSIFEILRIMHAGAVPLFPRNTPHPGHANLPLME